MSLAVVEDHDHDEERDLSTLTLDELAAVANEEHRLAEIAVDEARRHLSSGLMHAIRAGEALAEVKRQVSAGDWMNWLNDNFTGTPSWAMCYIRFAVYQDVLSQSDRPVNTHSAMKLLRGLPSTGKGRKLSGDEIRAVQEVRKTGASQREIAEQFGISQSRVSEYLNGTDRERRLARQRTRQRERRAIAAHKRQEEREAGIKAAGLDALYADLRKFALKLDATIVEQNREVAMALRDARSAIVRVEESIVRASKLSRRNDG